jgi:DMSO/TMAO reductase YedYZ molybdopterin-dependent catalytic subunit
MAEESAGKAWGGSLPPDSKLTRTKQRWAEEGRFLTGQVGRAEGERLPPGQHLVRDWPVLDLGLEPEIAADRWQLDVGGAVDNPLILTFEALKRLPRAASTSDIHCVTSWSRYDNHWEGIATRDLLAAVEPKPEARFVLLGSYDGYTTNLPLDEFAAADALLALTWEGQPLSKAHGGPFRLVVPKLYFWKSAKWLKSVTLVAEDRPGFWEVRGYHNHGDPWTEERYS